jgi:hypothetical protein
MQLWYNVNLICKLGPKGQQCGIMAPIGRQHVLVPPTLLSDALLGHRWGCSLGGAIRRPAKNALRRRNQIGVWPSTLLPDALLGLRWRCSLGEAIGKGS